ncbi:hypothetical protein PM082_011574 [Marasmius tenuissimus]|nr:hypothetical protein PM082_011574 [Marasmius tenuissimus]
MAETTLRSTSPTSRGRLAMAENLRPKWGFLELFGGATAQCRITAMAVCATGISAMAVLRKVPNVDHGSHFVHFLEQPWGYGNGIIRAYSQIAPRQMGAKSRTFPRGWEKAEKSMTSL